VDPHRGGIGMEFDQITLFLKGLTPWMGNVLMILGGLTVIGTAVDKYIPDSVDNGFMKKAYEIPFIGGLLKSLAKFSPFNVRE
jgi:hypothetical protein